MSGMLSALCGHYYKLKMKLYKRDDRFKELFDNVLKFKQNHQISELDDILNSRNKAYSAYDKTLITYEKVKETEDHIVQLLKMLGVRPNWIMMGEVAGEMEFELWYDEEDKVCIIKTKDLEPEPEDGHFIYINASGDDDDETDDDEDFDDDNGKSAQRDDAISKQIEAYHDYMREQGYESGNRPEQVLHSVTDGQNA